MELNGIAAIAKVLRQLKLEGPSGTFIGVPVANPLALMGRRPHCLKPWGI
jgi:predicted deacylase